MEPDAPLTVSTDGQLVSHCEQLAYFSSCACAGERGRGKGRKNTSGKMCTGFRSVCRNVGRANEIRAFKVIDIRFCKIHVISIFQPKETANL